MMKRYLALGLLTSTILVSSCDQEDKYILDVKEVINKTPRQVENILGEPDSTYMIKVFTKEYFAQRYSDKNIEIQYPQGTSTDIVIYGPHGLPFDTTALSAFNVVMNKRPDQFIENELIRWYDTEHFSAISFYHPEFDSSRNEVKNYYIFFKARNSK